MAANALVVIVGDVGKAKAEQMANELLSGLAIGQKPQEIPMVTMPTQSSFQHIDFPSTQTHVLAGMPGTYR